MDAARRGSTASARTGSFADPSPQDIGVVPKKHGQRYFLLNLVHLAAAFFLVFTAFSGIQVQYLHVLYTTNDIHAFLFFVWEHMRVPLLLYTLSVCDNYTSCRM